MAKNCKRVRVKFGKVSFTATKGTGCRKKRKDGVARQKPHWGAKASGKAKSRAMKNPEFRAMKNAMPKANKACARSTKAFTKARGACVAKHLRAAL